MKHIYYPLFFIVICIGSNLLGSTHVFAGNVPDTSIHALPITTFKTGKRLDIKLHINDSQGVMEARCYFKTKNDNPYLYTTLSHSQGDTYKGVIPALDNNTEQLQYFILIVNGHGQVIRSPLAKVSSSKRPQLQHNFKENTSVLTVFLELPDTDTLSKPSSISDKHIVLKATDQNRLFGLRAGIYNSSSLPRSLHAQRGFFGGFQLNDNNTISPVEGLAPYLADSITVPKSATEDSLPRMMPSSTPNIAGNDWSGYFQYGWSSDKTPLTATIYCDGTRVTIVTSKSGIAHYLAGSINSNGDMLVYDSYDGEAWTTHFGPATSTAIYLYDYAWPPEAGEPEPPLNKLKLIRPPTVPDGVTATDGTVFDAIVVSWNQQTGANHYEVFSCMDSTLNTCIHIADTTTDQFTDTSQNTGVIFYRIKACNDYGCSDFSDYDTGYERNRGLPFLELLLGKD